MKKYQQVSTGGLILNERNEILLIKRSDADSFQPGCWELPGGGVEFGEDPKYALKREIKEECGIDVLVEEPITVKTYFMEDKNSKVQRIEIIFRCKFIDSRQKIQLSPEHSDFKFLSLAMVSSLELSEFMKDIIKDINAIKKPK